MRPYSVDLRERIVAAVEQGLNQSEAARRFSVSSSTVSRYLAHQQERKTLAPRVAPGAKRKIPEAVLRLLEERIATKPDTTIAEHQTWLRESHQIMVSFATVHRVLGELGFTFKKSASSLPNATTTNAKSGGKPSHVWQSKASSS